MHSEYRGVEDIDAVYLLRSNDTHSPCYGITLDNLTQLLTTTVSQLLGVIELVVLVVLRKDDSSSIHTASQTTTTCLVTACLNLTCIIMTC